MQSSGSSPSMQDTAAECVECRCTMAPASGRSSYMARCRNDSLDGASPAMCRPAASSLDRRAGSSRPSEALVGVNSQPSSSRTLMLPLLPAVSPRSKSERPMSQIASRRRFSSACAMTAGLMAAGSQALRKKSGVPKFPDFSASASGRPAFVRQRRRPRHAGIDLGPDPQALDAQRFDHGPGGLAARDDHLSDPEPDQALRDRRPARSRPALPARPTPSSACAAFTSSGVAVA